MGFSPRQRVPHHVSLAYRSPKPTGVILSGVRRFFSSQSSDSVDEWPAYAVEESLFDVARAAITSASRRAISWSYLERDVTDRAAMYSLKSTCAASGSFSLSCV